MRICVYCGCHDNLNTELTITIDNKKIMVLICDEHSENATVKSARDAYVVKRAEIDKVIQAARNLGLNISESDATSPHLRDQQVQPKKGTQQTQIQEEGLIPTHRLNYLSSTKSVSGSLPGYGSLESLQGHDLSKLLPSSVTNGVAKVDVLEGREGIPTPIPTMRRDGTGTTRISIHRTTDDMLQNNFRKLASESMLDKGNNGYVVTDKICPMCNGDDGSCTKCGGTGIITIR